MDYRDKCLKVKNKKQTFELFRLDFFAENFAAARFKVGDAVEGVDRVHFDIDELEFRMVVYRSEVAELVVLHVKLFQCHQFAEDENDVDAVDVEAENFEFLQRFQRENFDYSIVVERKVFEFCEVGDLCHIADPVAVQGKFFQLFELREIGQSLDSVAAEVEFLEIYEIFTGRISPMKFLSRLR